MLDDLGIVAHLESLTLGDGLFDCASSFGCSANSDFEVPSVNLLTKQVLLVICLAIPEFGANSEALRIENLDIKICAECVRAKLGRPCFDFNATESTNRQGPNPSDYEEGNVVIEIFDCSCNQVSAFQNADLIL